MQERQPGGLSVQAYAEDNGSWDAFVSSHGESTAYHQHGWRQVVEKSFGHRTHYLTARNERNEIRGILPLVHLKSALFGSFLVSLPYFNYGGLLCEDDAAAAVLLEKSQSLLRETGADHLELRHLDRCTAGLATKQHKVTMILDLAEDEELQWQMLDAKVRNQVRKAEKSGLRAVVGGAEALDGFYDVFCRNMRDLGTPVYGIGFFRNVLAAFPETRIVSVTINGRVIAAGIMTRFRETVEVPWASSVRDFRELCPNNLLYWEAIRFAIASGAGKFDFGRSTPGEGTYRFKKQWGAKPVQLSWQYLLAEGAGVPELNPANPKLRMAVRVWQHLPVAITRLLGPGIVRGIP